MASSFPCPPLLSSEVFVDDTDPCLIYSTGWVNGGTPGLECEGTTHGSRNDPQPSTVTFTFDGVGVGILEACTTMTDLQHLSINWTICVTLSSRFQQMGWIITEFNSTAHRRWTLEITHWLCSYPQHLAPLRGSGLTMLSIPQPPQLRHFPPT
ncbi:hypothetical protein C8R41DRAFT_919819 [Lentinula lateritia]|uniref:Uncharacterized protein n=1 Tax=Lentinula lateritia TaxID=40482 RepID=A0ABQ8VGA1_9AGAR|nr:hypothetical protein C8R41DRAFT_919819 [Lentinula lateritia]